MLGQQRRSCSTPFDWHVACSVTRAEEEMGGRLGQQIRGWIKEAHKRRILERRTFSKQLTNRRTWSLGMDIDDPRSGTTGRRRCLHSSRLGIAQGVVVVAQIDHSTSKRLVIRQATAPMLKRFQTHSWTAIIPMRFTSIDYNKREFLRSSAYLDA